MNLQKFEVRIPSNFLIGVAFLFQVSRWGCVYMRFLFSRYTSPDFLYVRSWLPCIFFSGGVTVGNIGRQLAMVTLFFLSLSVNPN